MGHGLLGELGVGLVRVGHKGDAAGVEHARALNLAPFGKVARDNLLDVVRDVDAADVDGAVLSHKGADAAHVVAVVAVLVAAEAVDVGVEDVVDGGEAVEVFAVLAFGTYVRGRRRRVSVMILLILFEVVVEWKMNPRKERLTYSSRKEQTKVGSCYSICLGVSAVLGDVATALCGGLGEVLVFAITARPFVVPDVEDGSCLWWWLRLDQGWVDLWSRWALLSADDLFDFLAGGGLLLGDIGGCGGEGELFVGGFFYVGHLRGVVCCVVLRVVM